MRMTLYLIAFSCFALQGCNQLETKTNSLGMTLVRVDPGMFLMGSEDGDRDERPVHEVTISQPFYIGTHEVTNAQYEAFDPEHRALRGHMGFSHEDDEAVVFVDWHDAVAFTEWLSEKEGVPYRLATEAEWEYAARAGTETPYSTGRTLPDSELKNPRESWYPDKDRLHPDDVVSLTVGQHAPNAWGIFDVHGNVEEWTLDWYGEYTSTSKEDPVGRADGDFKVTRGGSHSTLPDYLRSANRLATLPEDKHWLIGFRVVQAPMPSTDLVPVSDTSPRWALDVEQERMQNTASYADKAPYFAPPKPYIHLEPTEDGPFFYHNHQAAISEMPNGDLMAIWYTTKEEAGRYLAQAASRLRNGADEWDEAAIFWDVPDRNDHGNALWWDGDETIYHVSGLSAAATWGNLALVVRTSTDNGVNWSRARIVNPNHQLRNQVIASMIRAQDGTLMVTADAVSIGEGGTAIHRSRDNGLTWEDAGGTIAGIHASVVQLEDGRLMALGRGDNIDGRMPMSLSSDMGATWTYSASPFPPINSTQRLVLLRLEEGPLFMASFADQMTFTDREGNTYSGTGLFGALSYDEGATWPVRRLITPLENGSNWVQTARSRMFLMSPYTAEPRGYLAVTQARDGLIHLISTTRHYAFNRSWLEAAPTVTQTILPSKASLSMGLPLVNREGLTEQPTIFERFSPEMETPGVSVKEANDTIVIESGPDAEVYWPFSLDLEDLPGTTLEIEVEVEAASANDNGLDIALLNTDVIILDQPIRRHGYHLRITSDAIHTHDAFALEPVYQRSASAGTVKIRMAIDEAGIMHVYVDDMFAGYYSPAELNRIPVEAHQSSLIIGIREETKVQLKKLSMEPGAFKP